MPLTAHRCASCHVEHRRYRRGKLKPQPCEHCGSPDAQKHHDDYGKPLQVRWLCEDCHMALHAGELPAVEVRA